MSLALISPNFQKDHDHDHRIGCRGELQVGRSHNRRRPFRDWPRVKPSIRIEPSHVRNLAWSAEQLNDVISGPAAGKKCGEHCGLSFTMIMSA